MKILLCEPGKYAREADIQGDLKTMQSIVGGTIEATYPWEAPVAVVCNDEGLLLGLPLNRKLTEDTIIAGTFFICGLGEENFADLSPEHLALFKKRLLLPQVFLQVGNRIIGVPFELENPEKQG